MVVRRPAGHRRHRPAHRLPHPPGSAIALPLAGDGDERARSPQVPTPRGEPGTVAVTSPAAATNRPTARAGAETPKLRVANLTSPTSTSDGAGIEAVRDVSFDVVDKPGRRRDRRLPRPVGLRQVDDPQGHRRPASSPTQGEILRRRAAGRGRRPRPRHGLPGLHLLRLAHRAPERGVRPQARGGRRTTERRAASRTSISSRSASPSSPTATRRSSRAA